jgi:uroporphyrinogen decarboxylase
MFTYSQFKSGISIMEKPVLKALAGKSKKSPVWMMRQAGRHLPEYRELRKEYSFLQLLQAPKAAAEASLQPLRRYDLDAVIVFSDILVPLQALGMDLDFRPGPYIANPLRNLAEFRALPPADFQTAAGSLMEALQILRRELTDTPKTLLGFAGAPYTLATYAIEGKSSKHFEFVKGWLYQDPSGFREILDKLADLTIEYLLLQVEAGAEAVQLFDTWAGELSLETYRESILPSTAKIFEALKKKEIPTLLYANGASHLIEAQIESGADAISVDWRRDISFYLDKIPTTIGIQGNLDPSLLFAAPEKIIQETTKILQATKGRGNHILNLGHGLHPTTPIEGVQAFVDTAKNFEPAN